MRATIFKASHRQKGEFPFIPLTGLSLFVFLVFVSSSCGGPSTQPSQSQGVWPGPLAVTFRSLIPYEKALRLITDLGLQPALTCVLGSSSIAGKSHYPQIKWEPVGQRESYDQNHQVLIMTSDPLANWWNQLNAAPEVSKVGFLEPPEYLCQDTVLLDGTPPANTPFPLSSREPLQYAHITFHHEVSYDTALYLMSNEGLYLTQPCATQDAQGKQEDGDSRGQEKDFTATSTLTVATHQGITSSLWQQQLRNMPEISSMTVFSQCTIGGSVH